MMKSIYLLNIESFKRVYLNDVMTNMNDLNIPRYRLDDVWEWIIKKSLFDGMQGCFRYNTEHFDDDGKTIYQLLKRPDIYLKQIINSNGLSLSHLTLKVTTSLDTLIIVNVSGDL